MIPFPRRLALIVACAIACMINAHCLYASCEGEVHYAPNPINIDEKSPYLIWIKKVEDYIAKSPLNKLILKATVTAKGMVTETSGLACCPGSQTPTPYTNLKGNFTGTLDLKYVVNKLPPIDISVNIPLGIGNTGAELKVSYTLQNGTTLSLGGTFDGRISACTCATVTLTGSGSPKVTLDLTAKLIVLLFGTNPLEPKQAYTYDLTGKGTVTETLTITGSKHFGTGCAADTLQFCFTFPAAEGKVTGTADFPIFGKQTFDFPVTLDVAKVLGLTNPLCVPQ